MSIIGRFTSHSASVFHQFPLVSPPICPWRISSRLRSLETNWSRRVVAPILSTFAHHRRRYRGPGENVSQAKRNRPRPRDEDEEGVGYITSVTLRRSRSTCKYEPRLFSVKWNFNKAAAGKREGEANDLRQWNNGLGSRPKTSARFFPWTKRAAIIISRRRHGISLEKPVPGPQRAEELPNDASESPN